MSKKQRPLDLRSLDDVADEVRRLRDGGYTPSGRWNLSQACDHLHETMRIGLDGDQPRVPWLARKVMGVLFRRRVLPSRAMRAGIPTISRLTPDSITEDDPARVDRCLATLAEARDFAGPIREYPLFDGITLDEWKELMVVHSQHHLAFLWPSSTGR
ncbi:MAG: DUF1569 domain-containing protein [Lacipirellulaceae bacterium]